MRFLLTLVAALVTVLVLLPYSQLFSQPQHRHQPEPAQAWLGKPALLTWTYRRGSNWHAGFDLTTGLKSRPTCQCIRQFQPGGLMLTCVCTSERGEP